MQKSDFLHKKNDILAFNITSILWLKSTGSVALFTKILTIKKCKTKIKKSFTKIILSVKIVLTLRVKLPCRKCKILIVREIFVSSFIVSEKIK